MFCADGCRYTAHATHQSQEILKYPETRQMTESDQRDEVAHVGICYVTERPEGLSIDCSVPTPSSFNFESYNFTPLLQNKALTMYGREPISSMSYAYYKPELVDLPIEVANSVANFPSCAPICVRQQQPIAVPSATTRCGLIKQQQQQQQQLLQQDQQQQQQQLLQQDQQQQQQQLLQQDQQQQQGQHSNQQQTVVPSSQISPAASIAAAHSQTLQQPQHQHCTCISAKPARMAIPMQTPPQPQPQVTSQQCQCNFLPLQDFIAAQQTARNCIRPQQQLQQLHKQDVASDCCLCLRNTCRCEATPPNQMQKSPECQQVQQQALSTCTNCICSAMPKQHPHLANLQFQIQPLNSNNSNNNKSEQQEQTVIRFDVPCFLADCNCNSPPLQPVQQPVQQQQLMTIQYPCTIMNLPNNAQRAPPPHQLPAPKASPPPQSTSLRQNNWSPMDGPCTAGQLENNHFPQITANNCMKVGCTNCNCWHFPRYSNWPCPPCVTTRIAEHNPYKTATCSQRCLS